MAHGEIVTKQMEDELIASLDVPGDDILRGSDFSLLDWRTYQGRDVDMVRQVSERAQAVIGNRNLTFYDGTVWDEAVRTGNLGPFLKTILDVRRDLCLLGPRDLVHKARWLTWSTAYIVPNSNAYSELGQMEVSLGKHDVYVYCMGLGATALIMRMRKHYPDSTHIDLGSVLDVFVGLGADRGWRRELYADPVELKRIIDKNLEGVL